MNFLWIVVVIKMMKEFEIVDVTGYVAMSALSFCTLLVKCLMKRLGRSALG